jgi:hypothetical protein
VLYFLIAKKEKARYKIHERERDMKKKAWEWHAHTLEFVSKAYEIWNKSTRNNNEKEKKTKETLHSAVQNVKE